MCFLSFLIYADVLNSRFTIKMLFAYTRHYTCTCTFHRKALFLFYMVFPPGITHINKLFKERRIWSHKTNKKDNSGQMHSLDWYTLLIKFFVHFWCCCYIVPLSTPSPPIFLLPELWCANLTFCKNLYDDGFMWNRWYKYIYLGRRICPLSIVNLYYR
jgi:hypothetical protein